MYFKFSKDSIALFVNPQSATSYHALDPILDKTRSLSSHTCATLETSFFDLLTAKSDTHAVNERHLSSQLISL